MSIASQLQRILDAKAALKASLEEKGVSIPDGPMTAWTASVENMRVPALLSIGLDDVNVGNTVVATVFTPKDAEGYIIGQVGENYTTGSIVRGKTLLYFTGVPAGVHNMVATYSGSNYLPTTDFGTFEVSKRSFDMLLSSSLEDENMYEIRVYVPDDLVWPIFLETDTGAINIYVNQTDGMGSAYIELGYYTRPCTLTATYPGDDVYLPTSASIYIP